MFKSPVHNQLTRTVSSYGIGKDACGLFARTFRDAEHCEKFLCGLACDDDADCPTETVKARQAVFDRLWEFVQAGGVMGHFMVAVFLGANQGGFTDLGKTISEPVPKEAYDSVRNFLQYIDNRVKFGDPETRAALLSQCGIPGAGKIASDGMSSTKMALYKAGFLAPWAVSSSIYMFSPCIQEFVRCNKMVFESNATPIRAVPLPAPEGPPADEADDELLAAVESVGCTPILTLPDSKRRKLACEIRTLVAEYTNPKVDAI